MANLVEQIVHRQSSAALSAEAVAAWPDIDAGALAPNALAEYLRRKQAVLSYLAGASDRELRKTVRFSKHTVAALVRLRCLKPHPDGNVYGWRGLVRYARINPFTRQKPIRPNVHGHGAVGALGLLLSLEPEFAVRLQRYILKTVRKDALGEIRRPRHVIWAWFLAELRKLGYEARNQWPFTVQTQGYSSVARYVDKLLAANPGKAAVLVGGPDAKKKLLTGDGTQRPQLNPFQRVEMDAHKLDCRICIMVPQLEGGWASKIVHRVWVICVVEVVTRAVLGYFLSLRREVALEDVMRALKCALSRWQLPEMVFASAQQLRPQAGLPSSHNEDYVGLCWEEMSVDGALAETCKTVKTTLANVVGSILLEPASSFSARRSKDDRPFIERLQRFVGQGSGPDLEHDGLYGRRQAGARPRPHRSYEAIPAAVPGGTAGGTHRELQRDAARELGAPYAVEPDRFSGDTAPSSHASRGSAVGARAAQRAKALYRQGRLRCGP